MSPQASAKSGDGNAYTLAAAAAGFAFLLALFPLQSHDVWWHLANGREVAAGRGIPRTNLYSFTHPEYPVTPTHWLFGLGAYLVHRAAGPSGLVVAKASVLAVAFLLAYVLARRRGASDVAACVVVALAALAARRRFLERPHLFTMLGLAAFSFLLHAVRNGRRRLVWVLPVLSALWANLHAGCLFGVGLVGIETVGGAASWLRARREHGKASDEALAARSGAVRIGLAAAGCALAAMASPAGWGVYGYNLWHVGLEKTVALVEFASPLPWQEPAFYLVLVGGAVALALDWRRVRASEALTFVAFGSLALYAIRGVPNFVLLAAPMIAPRLARGWAALHESDRVGRLVRAVDRVPAGVLGLALVFVPFSGHVLGGPFATLRVGLGVRRDFFPESSASFVMEHLPKARVFNDLATGGYLAWRWHPRRGVFVDGRTNAYPPELFRTMYGYEARAASAVNREVVDPDALDEGDLAELRSLCRRDEVKSTFTSLTYRYYSLNAALLYFYKGANPFWQAVHSNTWAVVHAEECALVLVRRRTGHDELIKRFERNLAPRGEAVYSKRLEAVGDVIDAAAAASRALAARDMFAPSERAGLLVRRGNGHLARGRKEPAAADYRTAIEIEPDVPEARLNLGFVLLDLEKPDEARAEFERALATGHRKGYAYFGLAQCAAAQGRNDEAARLYKRFISSNEGRHTDRDKAEQALRLLEKRP